MKLKKIIIHYLYSSKLKQLEELLKLKKRLESDLTRIRKKIKSDERFKY